MEPSLDRIRAFTELLGDPQHGYPVIHLTGTNGKTSTARMIDTLLRALELRTGRFTSPHVERMTERISLDGEPMTDEQFVQAFNDVAPYTHLVDAGQPHPLSFFETVVGMAYAAFADAPVDVAVVEVGLGGAWDATNVADAAVAVVLPIAVDHAHLLGDDAVTIAGEKAGIIKPDSVAVVAEQLPDVADVLRDRAVDVGARLLREGVDFGVATQVARGGRTAGLDPDAAGEVRRGLPAAVRRPPGAERRRRADRRRGLPRHRAARRGDRARRLRRGDLARPAGDHPPQPDDRARRRPQPARRPGRRRGARGLLPVRPAHRRDRRDGRQGPRGRAGGVRAAPGPRRVHAELHAAGDAGRAARRDGPRGVRRRPGHRRAVPARRHRPGGRAGRGRGRGSSMGSGAVLVTGSVVTVGEARHLLGGPK